METVLIFAGGVPPHPGLIEDLPQPDLIVAADGGYDHAVDLGFVVEVVVGDMDSIQTHPLPPHVVVERHPVDKDATDLELALALVARDAPDRVVVVGGSGGRLDHELSIAGLLCSERWLVIDEIDWVSERGWAYVVRHRRLVHGDPGTTVSLIPMLGDVKVAHTAGLKWNLDDVTLASGTTRGVSNILTRPVADIRLGSGCLLVVVPG
jgi:thiamine pyrophosphokinase